MPLTRVKQWIDESARRAFLRSLKLPYQRQERLRKQLTKNLANTEYGKLFSLGPNDSYEKFSQKIPIVTPHHLKHWITRQRKNNEKIITYDTVTSYEQSQHDLLIPYTKKLTQSFERFFHICISDISAFKNISLLPENIKIDAVTEIASKTALPIAKLSNETHLEILSVWDLSLLESISLPKLKRIFSWTPCDKNSLTQLSKHLHVAIQDRGLWSIYSPVAVRLIDTPNCLPLVDDVFLEFIDESGSISRLHELNMNQKYELVLSQHSGLTRCRTGNKIQVMGRYLDTPCFESIID